MSLLHVIESCILLSQSLKLLALQSTLNAQQLSYLEDIIGAGQILCMNTSVSF